MTSDHPLTYHEASTGSITDQIVRYGELAQHDALAGAIAIGKARGTYVPNEHVNEEKFPPLTVAEHLELLALGENIARYYRHPAQVHRAALAGATWEQIAAATGGDPDRATQAYRAWAEEQHGLWQQFPGGTIGLGDDEYAAALKAAGEPDPAAVTGTSSEDTQRLEAVRAVLAGFDWETSDRQYALEKIDRIVSRGAP